MSRPRSFQHRKRLCVANTKQNIHSSRVTTLLLHHRFPVTLYFNSRVLCSSFFLSCLTDCMVHKTKESQVISFSTVHCGCLGIRLAQSKLRCPKPSRKIKVHCFGVDERAGLTVVDIQILRRQNRIHYGGNRPRELFLSARISK